MLEHGRSFHALSPFETKHLHYYVANHVLSMQICSVRLASSGSHTSKVTSKELLDALRLCDTSIS